MSAGRWVVRAGAAVSVAGLVQTCANLRALRVPDASSPAPSDRLSLLLPVRDEVDQVGGCLEAVLHCVDRYPGEVEVVVLDDGSTDGTATVVRQVADGDPRVRLVTGAALPPGWLGKTWACHQLAQHAAAAEVLVFLDADVRLAPDALVATVSLLRTSGLDLVSPYPRQLVGSVPERLVQPLLQWSWMSTLPLRLAERSRRPSLSAANGQLLVVDRAAYRRAGGHLDVRDAVIEDVALVRSIKAAGGRGGVVDGTALATCRMYVGGAALREGYAKSLWAAFGSRSGAAAVGAVLVLGHVVPPVAALAGSRAGAVGYAASVASRVLVARRTGGRVADCLAHPLSVAALQLLVVDSWRRRRRGTLRWRGRAVGGGDR